MKDTPLRKEIISLIADSVPIHSHCCYCGRDLPRETIIDSNSQIDHESWLTLAEKILLTIARNIKYNLSFHVYIKEDPDAQVIDMTQLPEYKIEGGSLN